MYRLTVKDVPVNGFWSVSLYNGGGYFAKNTANAYTLNKLTAKKTANGSIVIQFGDCDKVANCLPTMDRWNYTTISSFDRYSSSKAAKITAEKFSPGVEAPTNSAPGSCGAHTRRWPGDQVVKLIAAE